MYSMVLRLARRRIPLSALAVIMLVGVSSVDTAALDIGETAPDFTLPSTTGGNITLSQYRGKNLVLIEFYGADFDPT